MGEGMNKLRRYGSIACGVALCASLVGCGAPAGGGKAKEGASEQPLASAQADAQSHPTSADSFTSATLDKELRHYDESKPLDLTPNTYRVAYPDEHVIMNDRVFTYDTTSGATVLPSRTGEEGQSAMDPATKDQKMFWTVQPPLGIVEGEYYHLDKKFNEGAHQDKGDPDDYFLGTTDLVVSDGKIRHIEFDEIPGKTYYNKTWAAQTKRRSGYAFFQFSKPRTDRTLVTWVNGQTFLEWQILNHNSLNLIFDTVYGSSNSARDVFIPSALELAEKVKQPSGQYYLGISIPNGKGLTPRLQLVYEGDKLVSARYDEIFSDYQSKIADPELKQFYRQSKYDSVPYREKDGGAFREWADKLCAALVAQNSLDVSGDAFKELSSQPEFANVKDLAAKIGPAVEKYKKDGYVHNVGTIGERPAGMVERPDQVKRQDDIKMTLKKSEFNADKSRCKMEVLVENVSDTPYKLGTGSYYMYVKNKDNFFDTVGDHNFREIEIPAKGSEVVTLDMGPFLEGDSDFALKYDGRNKVYHSMVLPAE